MRTFTDKDKRGLLVALRVFLRNMNGERISQTAGAPLIQKALDAGIDADILLNKGNWERAKELEPGLQFKQYVEILSGGRIKIRHLKDEQDWHLTDNGFAVVAEAAHDFFMEVYGNGGKWNIPSAHVNLAKAIQAYSLQALLSEKLILAVSERDNAEALTYFKYILIITKDFNSLPIETGPAERPQRTENMNQEQPGNESETFEPEGQEEPEMPEEEPYPEETDQGGFETVVIMQKNPNETKELCLRTVLLNYTPTELLGLVKTIDKGLSLTMQEIVSALANGRFDVRMEDAETRNIHQSINADLTQAFIDCVIMQGQTMDQEVASNYDILHDTWDLRSAEVRKRHKLLKLIYSEGKDDPDLMSAVEDIEKMYAEK